VPSKASLLNPRTDGAWSLGVRRLYNCSEQYAIDRTHADGAWPPVAAKALENALLSCSTRARIRVVARCAAVGKLSSGTLPGLTPAWKGGG
jgi:hypothetical protein